jgi:hypothetical protein
VLLNKWELLGEGPAAEVQLERVLDDVFELHRPDTPRLKTNKGRIDWRLVLGVDSTLARREDALASDDSAPPPLDTPAASSHTNDDVHVLDLRVPSSVDTHVAVRSWTAWVGLLRSLSTDSVWRVKGVLPLSQPITQRTSATIEGEAQQLATAAATTAITATPATNASSSLVYPHLLNFAFGRFDLTPVPGATDLHDTRITFMGDAQLHALQPHIRQQLHLQDGQLRALTMPVGPPEPCSGNSDKPV